MKYVITLLIVLFLTAPVEASKASEKDVMKIGDSIALHWTDGSPLRAFGDGKSSMDWSPTLGGQAMMWKVGDGILVLEHTMGIGQITTMSYVVRDAKGNTAATLNVKEFNPRTGEMTIILPNKPDEPDKK